MTKYKLYNHSRKLTRINLEDGSHVMIDNKEKLIIEQNPVDVPFGIQCEQVVEQTKAKKKIDNKQENKEAD